MHIVVGPAPEGPSWLEQLLALVPPALPWLFLILLLVLIGPDSLRGLLKRVTGFGIAGLSLQLKDEVKELAGAALAKGKALPGLNSSRLSRRLENSAEVFRGARILWVDDAPLNNVGEIDLMEQLGARVSIRKSTAEAQEALSRRRYDLILSDMTRDGDPTAGLALLPLSATAKLQVIFYVGEVKGAVPDGAFGITDRFDNLFHLVIDALERRRR